MTKIACHALGSRIRDVVQSPFGEPWNKARIEASVFFTFTFHRHEFEEILLPDLYGLPSDGPRSVRLRLLQLQLGEARPLVIHDARPPVDLDADGNLIPSANHARTASFRLDTVPVRIQHGACMHAKHILLRVRRSVDPSAEEVLIVVTTSANLTRAGWRENVELADIQVLKAGQSTSLKKGLTELVEDAEGWAQEAGWSSNALPASLRSLRAFVEGLKSPQVLGFPQLWTGRERLDEVVAGAATSMNFGRVRRLSVGAPYMSEDARPIRRLVERLEPASVHVMRPFDHNGLPLSAEGWETAVSEIEGREQKASIHPLLDYDPKPKDRPGRTTHLKWILVQNRTKGLLVLGSPNLSTQAFGPHREPGRNYETAVLLEAPPGLRLLSETGLKPHGGETSPFLKLDPNNSTAGKAPAFHLVYDWAAPEVKRVRLVGDCPKQELRLRELGTEADEQLTLEGALLGPACADLVRRALDKGLTLVEVVEPGTSPPLYVHIVEVNQIYAPPRSSFRLSIDQYLRYAIAAGLGDWAAVEREADEADRLIAEQDESIGPGKAERPSITLDRPILIIQAVMLLEIGIRAALEKNEPATVERLMLDRHGISLRRMVDLHLPSAQGGQPDEGEEGEDQVSEVDRLVGQLICWLCVKSALGEFKDYDGLPSLVELERLLDGLGKGWEMAREVDGAASADLLKLRDWMLDEWRFPKKKNSDKNAAEEGDDEH